MIKVNKLKIFDGLELKEATFKNKTFPIHFHETFSIGVIKKGIENLKVNDYNIIATSKSVVIINQNELHSNAFYNHEDWTYQTISLGIDALNFISKENNLKSDGQFVFQNLIEDKFLYNAISIFHKNAHLDSQAQMNSISSYLLKNYLVKKEEKMSHYPEWKNTIDDIKEMMTNNLIDKINLENIANKHDKNSFQLIRAFKAHTGLTPIAYLTLIKLNKSKILIANGEHW